MVRLWPAEFEALGRLAAAQGRPRTHVIVDALRRYMAEKAPPVPVEPGERMTLAQSPHTRRDPSAVQGCSPEGSEAAGPATGRSLCPT